MCVGGGCIALYCLITFFFVISIHIYVYLFQLYLFSHKSHTSWFITPIFIFVVSVLRTSVSDSDGTSNHSLSIRCILSKSPPILSFYTFLSIDPLSEGTVYAVVP